MLTHFIIYVLCYVLYYIVYAERRLHRYRHKRIWAQEFHQYSGSRRFQGQVNSTGGYPHFLSFRLRK